MSSSLEKMYVFLFYFLFFSRFFFFGNPYFIEMTSLAYYEKIKNVILICGPTTIFEILHRYIIERYSANVWHSLMRRIKWYNAMISKWRSWFQTVVSLLLRESKLRSLQSWFAFSRGINRRSRVFCTFEARNMNLSLLWNRNHLIL